jgi:hypothetical protein
MNTNQPILSCAGREAVSIDSALLTELLLSFTPNTIGIKEKAKQLANTMKFIGAGGLGDENHDYFVEVITKEFLYVQLMEASKLARQASEDAKQASSVDSM